MRKRLIIAAIVFGIAALAGFSICIRSSFAVENRVVDENDRVVLHGNVHPKARPELEVGPTDPSLPMERMTLLLKIAPEKQAELDKLIAEQQDHSSTNFHRWLTPEEFGERFGRSLEEIATVKNWLVSHGFTIDETAKGGTWINFSGTAANVDRAFQASMHDYNADGKLHHANSTDPTIPRALADLVAGPVTLHNFRHKGAHTMPVPMTERKPNYDNSDGSYSLSPGDFAVIYDVNGVYGNYDGAGETIALVERTRPNANKWKIFRSAFGLTKAPHVIVNGPDPGDLGANEDAEADLDVEWSGAVAKGATIDFVVSASTNSADGSDLSAQYIVNHNLAPIISDCFSTCESDLGSTWQAFYDKLWEQAASQGITVFVASGDTGAYDCTDSNGLPTGSKAVNGLGSTPYNIAVGGTQFNTGSDPGIYWDVSNASDGASALSYIPEVAWNDWTTPACGPVQGCEGASGGGASTSHSKPVWQVSPGVPNDGARDVPDVSLNADDVNIGYRVYTCTNSSGGCGSNSWSTIGGTSGGTPSFAGIMALLVQSAGGERQGNFNTALYRFGNAQYSGTSGAIQVFHDVTSGNNGFGAKFPGYSCGVGYDSVTGLGSVDALNLLAAFQAVGSGGSLTVTINPPGAVSEGAKWNVDNGTWQASGATVSNLGAWSHTVYFNGTPTDYIAPASQEVTISYGQAQTSTGTYVIKPPVLESLKIDNGATITSSQTVTLNNSATRSPTYYRASQYPSGISEATWQAYPTTAPYAPSFQLTGEVGPKTVYFQVKNAGGVSRVLGYRIVYAQPPGAPTISAVRGGNGIATVTFKLPFSNGSSPITSYTVTSSGGQTSTGTHSPIIVAGLADDTDYTFTVTATNAIGTGSASASSKQITTAPGAPTITSVNAGNAQATINFSPSASDGEGVITYYTVTSHPGGIRVRGTSTSMTVHGLRNGASYKFTVTATNPAGTSPASAPSSPVKPN